MRYYVCSPYYLSYILNTYIEASVILLELRYDIGVHANFFGELKVARSHVYWSGGIFSRLVCMLHKIYTIKPGLVACPDEQAF
jgi:hypothetical protein